MRLEIYRGTLGEGDVIKGFHVGLIDRDRPSECDVIALTGPVGDPEAEVLARRIKAMFEFCDPFSVEFMEQATEARKTNPPPWFKGAWEQQEEQRA